MAEQDGAILAIDQGTTNTKVLLIDTGGRVVAEATRPVEQFYPQPAWVEQDANALWSSVRAAIDDCLGSVAAPRPMAIALTNQRESVTAWERQSGQPLGPAITWQCRRTSEFCAELRGRGVEAWLAERTGLAIDPLFSGSKMRWLLEHIDDGTRRAERGEICLGTIDSWMVYNLTGGTVHATDVTNASRTQLMNIHTRAWCDELLTVFGVPRASLPELKPSSGFVGMSVALGRLAAGIPILSLIGDSHAALFGQAGFHPGIVKATYGTGSSLMTPTATPVMSRHGLSTTIAWALDDQRVTYALEGNIAVTGAAVRWLGEVLMLASPSEDVAALAASVADSSGVYLVPAFVGLGAPYWNDAVRGVIDGLTHGIRAPQLARAAVESMAYQVRDVFDVMRQEAGSDLSVLLADGGASRNDVLMQFQADIIGHPVLRSSSSNASALGAAHLAGLASGIWESLDELERLQPSRARFEVQMETSRREHLYAGWGAAVARALFEP